MGNKKENWNKAGVLMLALTLTMQAIEKNEVEFLESALCSNFIFYIEHQTGHRIENIIKLYKENKAINCMTTVNEKDLIRDAAVMTVSELSKKYGKTDSAIRAHLSRRNVTCKKVVRI